MTRRLRVVTYNVHKCRGLDRRVRPDRIAGLLRDLEPDIVGLQEVVSVAGLQPELDQAGYIAAKLGFHWALGENRMHRGGAYGNAVLSRFPLRVHCNYDLSVRGREPRGCLRTDVCVEGGRALHVYNVHLGTSYFERRCQARILTDEVLKDADVAVPRLVLGDFNEWTRGLVSRLLAVHLRPAELRRTYPAIVPVFHLDHIYYGGPLSLERVHLHRSPRALVASDHLPLVAEFTLA